MSIIAHSSAAPAWPIKPSIIRSYSLKSDRVEDRPTALICRSIKGGGGKQPALASTPEAVVLSLP